MAETVIKRNIYGLNGQRLENFYIANPETVDRWKNGELLFFPEEECFASFDVTEERDKKIEEMFDTSDLRDDTWHKTWESYTPEDKAAWYWEFVRNNYLTLTYEEFCADSSYIKQDIKVTFHVGKKDIEGVIFFTPTPIGNKIEV